MSDLILHHYPNSLFSEKVRLILGAKGLAWRSVIVPSLMPKPDVIALTGGYRKTPFMQVGADIYCDTALIAQLLEQRQPEPSLYPRSVPLAAQFAQWADFQLFWCAVTWTMQPAGAAVMMGGGGPEVAKAFAADRAAMTSGMKRLSLADATAQLKTHLAAFEAQLAAGGPFLFGRDLCIADFSVAHTLWFTRRGGPVTGAILEGYAAVTAWLDRMQAFGYATHDTLSSADAIAIAAAATSQAPVSVLPGLGFEPGQPVSIYATDYGSDPVAGTLVGLTPDEAVLARTDARAGTVHVHFPRAGYQVKKESAA